MAAASAREQELLTTVEAMTAEARTLRAENAALRTRTAVLEDDLAEAPATSRSPPLLHDEAREGARSGVAAARPRVTHGMFANDEELREHRRMISAGDISGVDLPLPSVVDWPDCDERGVWNGLYQPEDWVEWVR